MTMLETYMTIKKRERLAELIALPRFKERSSKSYFCSHMQKSLSRNCNL